jgi:hypothetical protein
MGLAEMRIRRRQMNCRQNIVPDLPTRIEFFLIHPWNNCIGLWVSTPFKILKYESNSFVLPPDIQNTRKDIRLPRTYMILQPLLVCWFTQLISQTISHVRDIFKGSVEPLYSIFRDIDRQNCFNLQFVALFDI